MDRTQLILSASFPSRDGVVTRELRIPRSQIIKIEFNDTTFNPGGPPGIGVRPSDGSRRTTALLAQDYAVLVDGHRQPCSGATIDSRQYLHCGKLEFVRGEVIRIYLATK
jgi:hypothetical protein